MNNAKSYNNSTYETREREKNSGNLNVFLNITFKKIH